MEFPVEVSIELLKWSTVVNTLMNIYTNKRTLVKYTVTSIVNHLHVSVALATIIRRSLLQPSSGSYNKSSDKFTNYQIA